MKGVSFGDFHSYRDFSLILSQKTIGAPSPKTETIDIPGGDGVLDLTEFFGEVKYNNRNLSFEFSSIVPQSDFMNQFSHIQDALHGQKMQIILDDAPEWYYTGRISVSEWKAEKAVGKLTIDCDCEPYRAKLSETVVTAAVDGPQTVILTNGGRIVVPTIDITGEVQLTFGYNFYTLSAGRYDLPAVQLVNGENTILLDGAGTATFTYLERGL
jgi:phage-related protein